MLLTYSHLKSPSIINLPDKTKITYDITGIEDIMYNEYIQKILVSNDKGEIFIYDTSFNLLHSKKVNTSEGYFNFDSIFNIVIGSFIKQKSDIAYFTYFNITENFEFVEEKTFTPKNKYKIINFIKINPSNPTQFICKCKFLTIGGISNLSLFTNDDELVLDKKINKMSIPEWVSDRTIVYFDNKYIYLDCKFSFASSFNCKELIFFFTISTSFVILYLKN